MNPNLSKCEKPEKRFFGASTLFEPVALCVRAAVLYQLS